MIYSFNKLFSAVAVGASRDLRTNVWKVTCLKCKKSYNPQTTLFSFQDLSCEKCSQTDRINYNQK